MPSGDISIQPKLADYVWLIGPDGRRWLDSAKFAAAEPGMSLTRLASRLRRDLTIGQVHLLLEQLELRHRARQKFPLAKQMFFTRLGLEQATDHWVAAYKAGRFTLGQPVADLCCGIGGDASGLVRRGHVRAVDRDPVAGVLAQANVEAMGDADPIFGGAWKPDGLRHPIKVECRDVADASAVLDGVAAWHIDPDRRPAGKRTTKVELHEPGPEILQLLLSTCQHAAIKLAPAADLTEPFWADAELEWISRGRQCRQLVAWFGQLAQHSGKRRATVVRLDVAHELVHSSDSELAECVSFVGTSNLEPPLARQVGRYVFEPDPAILAAKLEGALVAGANLAAIAPGVAYFTADHANAGPMLECFEVLEVMPYRTKVLREWLAVRGIGRLEVKKRGVPLEPAQIRRSLLTAMKGCEECTILLARVEGRLTSIIAKRR